MQAKDIWFRKDVLCDSYLFLSKARIAVDGEDEGDELSRPMEESIKARSSLRAVPTLSWPVVSSYPLRRPGTVQHNYRKTLPRLLRHGNAWRHVEMRELV